MLYKIINNYASKELYEKINNIILLSESFPWYYHNYVATKEEICPDHFYFTHNFYINEETDITLGYPNSEHFSTIIIPVCSILLGNDIPLIKAKANLFTKRDKKIKYGMHIDYDCEKHTTWVYSLNSNNGYTEFEDGTIIPSIENQLLIFDGNIPHRSVGQTDTNTRINLNINLKMDSSILCKN